LVKLGFIVEGSSDKLVLESELFRQFLDSLRVHYVQEVINARGCGNQLSKNRNAFTALLRDKGATHIFILTDQDSAPCYTARKVELQPGPNEYVVISRKMLESWFLADKAALSRFLATNDIECSHPELIDAPLEEIGRLSKQYRKRGVSDKLILAKLMLKSGFSILGAAAHPHCQSAAYFAQKLKLVGNGLT
jgi:hypothetical protein